MSAGALIFLCELARKLTKLQRAGFVPLNLAGGEFVDTADVDFERADRDHIFQKLMSAVVRNEMSA